ncbi:ankyrin repeat domain-containing protein [Wolbachia endosymbiont (group A) of Pogonocherus hispidulus]|uniref:ankyrin repeat domain-containing protein n=1 Tax=Wolbachia endosymbiont (group A) of Pogonocherus hispidulus TaxID=3066136 RepID=UPI00333EC778
MIHHKWLEILSAINSDNDLNRDNIIEKIKEKLKAIDPTTYKEWKKFDFNVNYWINNCVERCTLLHIAAGNGYIKAVKTLLEIGAKVNAVDLDRMTPLHLAAKGGYTEIVKTLTDADAKVNAVDLDRMTPLHLAAKGGYTEIVKTLTDADAKVNAVDLDRMTPLHLAAKGGYTEIVKTLTDAGTKVNAVDGMKRTPLHMAAKNGHIKTMNALLEKGAEINIIDKKGLTPLSLAAENGHKEAVYALMEKEADLLLGNKNRTLKYLEKLTRSDNLKQFRKEQRDDEYESLKYSLLCRDDRSLVDVVGGDTFNLMCIWFTGISALTPSQRELNKELFSILQAYQSFSDEGDYNENGYIVRLRNFLQDNGDNQDLEKVLNLRRGESKLTVLHIISSIAGVEKEYDDSVALLLKAGANPNVKDDRGKTPLHYATGPNSVASLMEKGTNLNEQDNEGKTPLHCIASTDYNDLISSFLDSGARSDICDKQGKIPLDIAIDNCNYYAEGYLLTEDQKRLQQELDCILGGVDKDNPSSLSKGLTVLEKFLNERKGTQDLKRVLSLHNNEGKLRIFQYIRDVFHSDETCCKEAERLLLVAGAKDFKELDSKEHLFKSRTLWDDLIPTQQKILKFFLCRVDKAQDINELEQVVNKAIECKMRFNFPHQGKLYGKMYEKYGFMDYVIKRIKEISELKKDPKVASDIICKLVSKGAVLYNKDSMEVINALESEFKDHKTNMKKAHEEYVNNTLEFMKIVKSAATGRVKNAKMDSFTFYLEYSEDSKIDIAKITNGARDLGLTQGEIEYGRDIIKIGKSEVEIITNNDIRHYTDLADNSNIVLTFYTSLGELEVNLYPDKQDKIIVEVSNKKEILEKFKNCKEELGENCSLGGYWVYGAIEQGYFERSGKLCQSFETISLSKKVSEGVKAAVKGLKCGDIVSSPSSNIFPSKAIMQEGKARVPGA